MYNSDCRNFVFVGNTYRGDHNNIISGMALWSHTVWLKWFNVKWNTPLLIPSWLCQWHGYLYQKIENKHEVIRIYSWFWDLKITPALNSKIMPNLSCNHNSPCCNRIWILKFCGEGEGRGVNYSKRGFWVSVHSVFWNTYQFLYQSMRFSVPVFSPWIFKITSRAFSKLPKTFRARKAIFNRDTVFVCFEIKRRDFLKRANSPDM